MIDTFDPVSLFSHAITLLSFDRLPLSTHKSTRPLGFALQSPHKSSLTKYLFKYGT